MWIDSRPAASFVLDAGYRHAERLIPTVAGLLSSTGLEPSDLDLVAVTSGPGSFTGLRVGITTARVLAWTLDAGLVAVPTLDALACGARLHRGVICAAIDARREAAFAACYRWSSPPSPADAGIGLVVPPRRVGLGDLVAGLREQRGPVLVVGDVVARYRRQLLDLGLGQDELGAQDQAWVRPEVVAMMGVGLAGEGRASDPLAMAPSYLRESGAERGRRA